MSCGESARNCVAGSRHLIEITLESVARPASRRSLLGQIFRLESYEIVFVRRSSQIESKIEAVRMTTIATSER